MAECKKCGRPIAADGCEYTAHACFAHLDPGTGVWADVCNAVAAAYRRGIARGVVIAKEHATNWAVYTPIGNVHMDIDWTDVDRAVREECGE